MYTKVYRKFFPRWIPTRVLTCAMLFTACWTSYMCRLQMPILAVPMIKALPGNASAGACVEEETGGRRRRSVPSSFDLAELLQQEILEQRFALHEAEGVFLRTRRQRAAAAAAAAAAADEVDSGELERKGGASARPADASIELMNGRPFDWPPEVRGQLIAAYSYGNVPGNFVGGLMAMKYGPRRAILWTSVVAAVLSLLSPVIAQLHWGFLAFSRVLVGVTGGVTFPACHTMVAKWAPPDEKARFVWSLLGGTFGTVFTYPMIAVIAQTVNWECGWYIPSLLMFVWCIFWALCAYDSPQEHPGISDEERDYILKSQEGTVLRQKPTLKQTPVRQIFASVPFISLVICHTGNLFLLFFYQNAMMLYLTKALGFQLAKGGVAASLPWAGRMLFGFFFSWAADVIRKKEIVSVTTLRKSATIFSHFLPGVFLILVGYVGCSLILANVFLFLALGFNGAASIANLSNNQDLSPNFAGFLYGIMNTIGSTSGMIIPPMVEEIAGKHGNPIDKWQIVFWIGAGVCIFCMCVFIVGGSGKIQKWNEIHQQSPDEETGQSQPPRAAATGKA